MLRDGNVAYETAYWSQEGDAALTGFEMEEVVGETGGDVAYKGDDEDGGDFDIVDVVVWLNLDLVDLVTDGASGIG